MAKVLRSELFADSKFARLQLVEPAVHIEDLTLDEIKQWIEELQKASAAMEGSGKK